jgi:hypothetical protein
MAIRHPCLPRAATLTTLVFLALTSLAGESSSGELSAGASLIMPEGSLKAHRPGAGVSIRWEHALGSGWWSVASAEYQALFSDSGRVPMFQMFPIQAGVKRYLWREDRGPNAGASLGVFPTVESFNFDFPGHRVADNDWELYWGVGLSGGYHVWRLEAALDYQWLFPAAGDARLYRLRLGYHF